MLIAINIHELFLQLKLYASKWLIHVRSYLNKIVEEHKINDHVKNMKDIQDIQPLIHVCCRGVAGSVHLTATTAPPCWYPFSKKFWLTTRSQHTMPLHYSLNDTKMHTMLSIHTHNSLPVWVEQYHLHTLTNLSHMDRLFCRQTVPTIPPAWVLNLINWLTQLMPGQWGGIAKIKNHM